MRDLVDVAPLSVRVVVRPDGIEPNSPAVQMTAAFGERSPSFA